MLEWEGEASAGQHPREEGGRYGGQARPGLLQVALVHLRFGDPLGFGATVLEPNLDLSLSQLQLGRHLGPLGDRKVGLVVELLLQLSKLLVSEGSARLAVRLMFPQTALERELRKV